MDSFEIEIKSLLGSKESADTLVKKMRLKDKGLAEYETHKQLNHYFVGGNLDQLFKNVERFITDASKLKTFYVAKDKIKDYTLRTRLADKKLLLVLKASIDESASANAKARIEFEWEIKDMTLEKLDAMILDSGFKYQAKWSRERTDYKYRGANVSIDKNAGYGYIAEFEKVVNDKSIANDIKRELLNMMRELDIEELPQDRLERMFAHYNAHWPKYYGTERIFTIE